MGEDMRPGEGTTWPLWTTTVKYGTGKVPPLFCSPCLISRLLAEAQRRTVHPTVMVTSSSVQETGLCVEQAEHTLTSVPPLPSPAQRALSFALLHKPAAGDLL